MSSPHPLPVYLGDLRGILLATAAMVRDLFQKKPPVRKKLDGTPLTRADVLANQYLYEELSRLLPGAAWLSEESAQDLGRLDRTWVWLVDPLDGTKEFARDVPEFAVSVALIHEHRVVLGGVVNPITGEGGMGTVYGEACFWGLPPSAARAGTLLEATACISRTEVEDGTVIPFKGIVGTTRPVGSVAYKLLRVAAGLEDLTFSVQHKSEWDIGGGIGLLHSVGKVYRRFDEQPVLFNQPNTRIRCGAVAGRDELVIKFIHHFREMESFSKKILFHPDTDTHFSAGKKE